SGQAWNGSFIMGGGSAVHHQRHGKGLMTERITSLLTRLYPQADIPTLTTRLIARIEQTKARIKPTPPRESIAEHDVLLITYGGSLRREGQAPLQTLYQFATKHLQGVISAIHILPFFPYTSDDGFAVKDFYQVNPDLGTWDDIRRIADRFELMADLVINHMSAQSDWFKGFLADHPAFAGLFRTESPEANLNAVVRPRVTPLLTPFERPNGDMVHVWTTFSADQVDFDFRHTETLMRMVDVLLFYVEQGAQWIRLDAIAFLWKIVGTNCLHLPETHAVVQLLRAILDQAAPHVILITETNVPHPENISYWGNGYNEAHVVYNFALPPLLFYTLLSADSTHLRDWVNTLKAPSPQTTFLNFAASHDGIGVRPAEGLLDADELALLVAHVERRGGGVSFRRYGDGTLVAYELNSTFLDAVTDPDQSIEMQVRRFLVSQAIMLAMAGIPAIYIHSLLGSHNDVEGVIRAGYKRAINRQVLNADEIEAELAREDSFRSMVFYGYLSLLQIRCGQRAFHPNAPQMAVDLGNPAVFALLRGDAQIGRVLAVHNVSAQPQTVTLEFKGYDLISKQGVSAGEWTLAPYQIMWVAGP
ncbi:MAG: alpha-amylase family glycosyl hydrolase, partial [Anaerolinea sp.]